MKTVVLTKEAILRCHFWIFDIWRTTWLIVKIIAILIYNESNCSCRPNDNDNNKVPPKCFINFEPNVVYIGKLLLNAFSSNTIRAGQYIQYILIVVGDYILSQMLDIVIWWYEICVCGLDAWF